jgi:hypothetical protein
MTRAAQRAPFWGRQKGRPMWKLMLILPLALLSACASFVDEVDHFRFAVMSPLRDFNLTQAPIPGQLQSLAQPYGFVDQSGCQAWGQEINDLETALSTNEGRRVGFRRDSETFTGRTGNLRDSGVRSATSQFIPFRSVVRQASGASRFEQRAENASDRARYRIGYLVGLGRSHRCPGFGTLSPFAPQPHVQAAWTQPASPVFRTESPVYARPSYSQPSPRYSQPRYAQPIHRTVASTPYGTVQRR